MKNALSNQGKWPCFLCMSGPFIFAKVAFTCQGLKIRLLYYDRPFWVKAKLSADKLQLWCFFVSLNIKRLSTGHFWRPNLNKQFFLAIFLFSLSIWFSLKWRASKGQKVHYLLIYCSCRALKKMARKFKYIWFRKLIYWY